VQEYNVGIRTFRTTDRDDLGYKDSEFLRSKREGNFHHAKVDFNQIPSVRRK